MLKKTLLFVLLMVFFTPWAVGQSTATFNDGTIEYSVVPVYGTYADYGSKSQFIIPATDMAAKNITSGATISKLTFYHSSTSQQDFFGTSCIVKVGEVSYSYFSTATFETSNLTTVFSGNTLTRNADGTMDVTFSTDYNYKGGNLLISIGGYGSKSGFTNWYSIQSTNDLSVWAYNNSSTSGYNIPTTAQQKINIAPKTTITYTSCTVDLTGNTTLTNNFSSSSDLDCWTLTNCSGSTGTTLYGRFRFWCDSSHDPQYLITPEIIAPSNGIHVKFDYKYEYESYYPKMRVGYSTSGNDVSDFTNWTEWITVLNGNFVTFNKSFLVSGIKYIAIQYDRNGYSSNSHLYIDDLVISKAPATATTDGNWNSAAIWSTGAVPSSSENVVIASNVTIPNGCTATANNITINGGSLTIADGGQLVCNNAVQATMQKHITGYNAGVSDWYFIASPVAAGTTPSTENGILNADPNNYDLFYYDQHTNVWINYKNDGDDSTPNADPGFVSAGGKLLNGKGYLYATSEDINLVFQGVLSNNGTVSLVYDDSADPEAEGWNLVGNPFPCNATADMNFYIIDGNIANASTGATVISPCTGVMVQATGSDQNVTFTKAADQTPDLASADNGNIQITLAHTVATRDGASTSSATIDNAIVNFNEGSRLEKFYFGSPAANIYIPQNHKEYAIVSAEKQGEMPMSFVANENGEYTITVNPENVGMSYLHLIDNMTGADVDLLVNPNYTFTAKTTDYESRFRLVFSTNDINDNENENFAFISNGQLIVNGTGTIQIIDMMGRVIVTKSTEEHINTNGMTSGVYVLQLITNTETKTQKIIVK